VKNASRIIVTAVAGAALAAATWVASPDLSKAQPATNQQGSAQTQSVSGRIASVDKDSFTLNVTSPKASGQTASQQPATAKTTMTFLIDKNTTVDGTLKVDSNAEVTYRQDNGANVAISVRVAP
jgi:hypothetical protein